MTTSTRRLLGLVLLVLAIVGPLALALSVVWSRTESHSETTGTTTVTIVSVESYWPLWVQVGFPCVAGAGLLLSVLPSREKANAH